MQRTPKANQADVLVGDSVLTTSRVLFEYRGRGGKVLETKGLEALVQLDQKPGPIWFYRDDLFVVTRRSSSAKNGVTMIDSEYQPMLNAIRDQALETSKSKGFTEALPAEDIALMHSELSEALEDIRAGKPLDLVWYENKNNQESTTRFISEGTPNKPCGVPSEMADVIIRVLHFCGKHNIDIDKAVREKMQYNSTREYKHGKTL